MEQGIKQLKIENAEKDEKIMQLEKAAQLSEMKKIETD